MLAIFDQRWIRIFAPGEFSAFFLHGAESVSALRHQPQSSSRQDLGAFSWVSCGVRRTTLPLAQVLVVLDAEATPYTRIWCMFEQACGGTLFRTSSQSGPGL